MSRSPLRRPAVRGAVRGRVLDVGGGDRDGVAQFGLAQHDVGRHHLGEAGDRHPARGRLLKWIVPCRVDQVRPAWPAARVGVCVPAACAGERAGDETSTTHRRRRRSEPDVDPRYCMPDHGRHGDHRANMPNSLVQVREIVRRQVARPRLARVGRRRTDETATTAPTIRHGQDRRHDRRLGGELQPAPDHRVRPKTVAGTQVRQPSALATTYQG